MAQPSAEWFARHHRLLIVVFALMLAAVGVEGLLLHEQWRIDLASKAQSNKLLTAFLHGDTAQVLSGSSVHIRLQNVRFEWSDRVYIDAGNMAVRAVPVHGTVVNFDDLESFHLLLQKSVVTVRPEVLAGMFNESVFNYPASRVRDLKVSIAKDDHGVETVVLDGKVNMIAWLPFKMYTHLGVDPSSNTMVITVDHLKLFGVLPATKLISWTPLHLDRVIALPPNKSLLVHGNQIMVKPFGLFPPPRVDGTMAAVAVDPDVIRITFAGDPIAAPQSDAKNYVFLQGGASQFGHFRMADTDVLILDKNPSNPFVFSLQHYAEMIPRSTVDVPDTKSARVTMPDYGTAPTLATNRHATSETRPS